MKLSFTALALLLVACSSSDSGRAKRDATPSPHWARHVICEGSIYRTAVAADFGGDDRLDVIVGGDGECRLYLAPRWTEIVLTVLDRDFPIIHSDIMDVDGDGDVDYVGAVHSPGHVFWLERPEHPSRGPWPYHLVDDQVDGTHGVIVGDVDSDGRPDLLANSALPTGPYPESLVWYEVPDDPRRAQGWIRHVFADRDAPGLSHYLAVGDVDGDGLADAASAAKAGEDGNWFAWWEQPADGSTPWTKHVLAERQDGATNIAMADINGDETMDFVASRGHGRGVLWFEAPSFEMRVIDESLEGPHCLATGDIDGDGDVDVATCAKDSFVVAWFENDGGGAFTTHPIFEDQAAYDLRLVDMDVDADLDLLVAGQESRNVVWYENRLSEP